MNWTRRTVLIFLGFLCLGLTAQDNSVKITLIQMNDVYELLPLGNDRGGLARVATLRKQLEKENPNTYVFLAGDLISPSAVGTAKINGERLAGKQMIAAMNALGLDYMTFGNHEFDVDESQLLDRIAESKFHWISGNVYHRKMGHPFPGVAPRLIFNAGGKVNVGIFSLCLNQAQRDYVVYDNNLVQIARRDVKALREGGADIVIGFTHLSMAQDKMVGEEVAGIDLILGGHEHEAQSDTRYTPVFKADANAQTVYIHHLTYETATGNLNIDSKLKVIDGSIKDDPATLKVAKEWFDKAIKALGVDPNKAIVTPTEDLDGREASIRNGSTLLTRILADGMMEAGKAAKIQASIYNVGSIRVDDVLRKGTSLSEYDILRVLPFGGEHQWCEIRGDLLVKTLDQGLKNAGSGGYLQYDNITGSAGNWKLGGKSIKASSWYKITFSDYLLTGRETNLPYLKCEQGDCPGDSMKYGGTVGNIQEALVTGLKKAFP
ncbi:MAG: 5'-nucleotidase C-terminal domain-containing protein [Acidobacteriota bacterium]|nr:5'-nucleotidase C-terminal domain-containing protein [Acidobacteriota bacterium]